MSPIRMLGLDQSLLNICFPLRLVILPQDFIRVSKTDLQARSKMISWGDELAVLASFFFNSFSNVCVCVPVIL